MVFPFQPLVWPTSKSHQTQLLGILLSWGRKFQSLSQDLPTLMCPLWLCFCCGTRRRTWLHLLHEHLLWKRWEKGVPLLPSLLNSVTSYTLFPNPSWCPPKPHIGGPLPDLLYFVTRSLKLNSLLQICPPKCHIQGTNSSPSLANKTWDAVAERDGDDPSWILIVCSKGHPQGCHLVNIWNEEP